MSLRWPDLDLLRAGRGDLVALSPLSQATARTKMIEALRRLEPALAVQRDRGADVAILDALAACVEVMGFYHDRFLTESKLGSAQLIDDLGKIVALIGYRPMPAIAATAFQWFEALAPGIVTSETRVSGKIATPPATVIYETSATIDVAPELNRMALSPLITRSPGALRAIVAPTPAALPTDDFRPQTRALISDSHGLELAPIAGSRSRGVAFGRALSRSFEPTAQVSRATVIRRLRGPRALASDLVAFEVSTTPILHLPSLAAPELLTSTLEIFVLRPEDQAIDPSEWPPALRYEERVDFSASEAGDLHYRTFVDDQLSTWIILRTALGARTLLDDGQLARVHARFVPAVGSMRGAAPTPDPDIVGTVPTPALDDVTLRLDASYFATSLVVPPLANQVLAAGATWAMVDRDLGLGTGDSILIQDGSGTRWIRTLIARAPGASPRLLRWAPDAAAATLTLGSLPEAHDAVDGALDPATARIGSLRDAASGDAFPTWRELYAQLSTPGALEERDDDDFPLVPTSPTGRIARRRIVAAGTTHLVVRDASHIAVGDYVLLGQRLSGEARVPQLLGPWRTTSDEPVFDPRTPWLDAEIVQAVEVRGNVVRLATPVSQDYFVHEFTPVSNATSTVLSEVIVLPGVVSVASGDQLRQTLSLATVPSFQGDDGLLHDASYTRAKLARAYTAAELRRAFGLDVPASKPAPSARPAAAAKPAKPTATKATGKQAIEPPPPPMPPTPPTPPTPIDAWSTLFVAVAGVAEAQPDAAWSFDIIVRAARLRAPLDVVTHLEDAAGNALTDDLAGLPREAPVTLRSAAAAASVADHDVLAVLHEPLVWQRADEPLAAEEFAVRELVSFDVHPAPPDAGGPQLFPAGGTLILRPGEPAPATAERRYAFTWPADADAPHVAAEAPSIAAPIEATLISDRELARRGGPGATLTADWSVPRERFRDPAFRALAAGTLVGASPDHVQRVTCTFTRDGDASLELHDLALASNVDPLLGCAEAWAVWPGELPAGASVTSAAWSYPLAPDDPGALPASVALRLALVAARPLIVDAHTSADGRSATIDPASAGDLGFALDALYGLEVPALAATQIAASEIWAWQGISPPLVDLPEPLHAQLVAVVPARDRHGIATIAWSREAIWWDAERRTLRLPTAPLAHRRDVRPADVARLLQVFAPAIDHRQLAIQYDPITDRSIVTLALAPGWPHDELAPAPVVLATRDDGHGLELRDAAAPVDVLTTADGHVRWTLVFAGDVRARWTDVRVVLRDWSAPGERGLSVAPLWRVPGTAASRARAAAGAVTLIATTCHDAGFRALAAMPRVTDDGAIELAPIGPGRVFPAPAEITELAIAIYERTARATDPPLHLVGTTILELGPIPDPPPPVTHVVFVSGDAWRPIAVVRSTAKPDGGRRYELAAADLAQPPGPVPREPRLRLCYARSELAATAPATLHTLRLRLDHPGVDGAAATAVAFRQANPDAVLVLESASPPTRDGDALVLALAGTDRDRLFDAAGQLQWTSLHVALRWRDATLAAAALRVELGDVPYAIVEADVLEIGFADGHTVLATVRAADDDGRALRLMPTTPVVDLPDRLTLRRLRITIDPADCGATLALTPITPQPPWLLSFDRDRNPSSLGATLLPYASTTAEGRRQIFRFVDDPAIGEIFRRAGDADTTLHLFSNERSELRGELYTDVDHHLKLDLEGTPVNFVTEPDDAVIGELIVTSTAWAVQDLHARRPILITAIHGSPTAPRLELTIAEASAGRVATNTVVQSTRFNTGNFIPLARHGGASSNPAALIANALRISARPAPRDDESPPAWQPVDYVTPDELSDEVGKLPSGTMASFNGMTYRDALHAQVVSSSGLPSYRFSASFSSAGVCTLHFLLIDEALVDVAQLRIETQYAVGRGRVNEAGDSLYPLETPVVAFDPARQLALLAPNQLKPDALVFVRQPGDSPEVPALQWTRVTRVIGPIVEVEPPIAYAATALEPIAVTALGRLQNAAQLDADYYAAVAKAKLVPGGDAAQTTWRLPLRDRLPLDILAQPPADDLAAAPPVTPSLLAALIPGDLVLVFDERQRQAWGNRRQGAALDAGWQTWPDAQHEAVVKAVNAETGMLVLAAPLPDSVQLRWTLDRATHRLIPDPDDVAALRVVPHYRAPVQGPRTLDVLGSGNRSHRFARYQSALEAGTGSAVIPIAAEGVTVGNLEIVAFDPEKATWSRWMRFDKLARAGKKDPAFTLGFRPSGPTGQVPVSVTFGDGITGQLLPTGTRNVYLRSTHIGAPASAAQTRVRIIARDPAGPSDRVPTPSKLKLRLACSAPDELIGGSDLGAAQWRPSLQIDVVIGGERFALSEITQGDAAAGAHGFVLVSDPDLPPGVVDAYLYTQQAIPTTAAVTVTQRPGSRTWTLDGPFYTEASRRELTVVAGAVSVQLLATTGLRAGSLLAVYPDDASLPDIVRLASIDPPTWSAVVTSPLPRAYDLERSFMRGNIAPIVQGAVDRTTLGSSDGVTPALRLALPRREPLLHVDRPGKEPAPDITVFVAGLMWDRVLDFTNRTPADRVWRLDHEPDGASFIVFGDGKHGAIPPAGRDHIDVRMRLGTGAAGNLPTGAINKLVSGNLAVKSTANLRPASGGSAGDLPAQAREKAFAHKLPSDRVVSAGDCVRAALGLGGVTSAALDPGASPGTLRLVVAMVDRRVPTADDLAAIHDQIADEMPATAHVRLEVVPAVQAAVHLVIELGVDPAYPAGEVFAAVTAALARDGDGLFAPARWDIGEPLRLGTIYEALQAVTGVATARVVWLAATPLLDGEQPSGPAPDAFDPGATGVVRCDNDRLLDPFGRAGTFRLEPAPEATS